MNSKKVYSRMWVFLLLGSISTSIGIASMPAKADTSAVAAESDTIMVLQQRLQESFPAVQVDRIRKSNSIPGLYEVLVGTEVFYVTADGQHALRGDIYDLKKGKTNLTELSRANVRKSYIEKVNAEEFIEYAPKNADTKYYLYVFTDVDCGYCRQLHAEIPQLHQMGIAVRYLAYPRNGVATKAGKKMRDVWCSARPQLAMDYAKKGRDLPAAPEACQDPLRSHYLLGNILGVDGTPFLMFDNGRAIPGYQPPPQLQEKLRKFYPQDFPVSDDGPASIPAVDGVKQQGESKVDDNRRNG